MLIYRVNRQLMSSQEPCRLSIREWNRGKLHSLCDKVPVFFSIRAWSSLLSAVGFWLGRVFVWLLHILCCRECDLLNFWLSSYSCLSLWWATLFLLLLWLFVRACILSLFRSRSWCLCRGFRSIAWARRWWLGHHLHRLSSFRPLVFFAHCLCFVVDFEDGHLDLLLDRPRKGLYQGSLATLRCKLSSLLFSLALFLLLLLRLFPVVVVLSWCCQDEQYDPENAMDENWVVPVTVLEHVVEEGRRYLWRCGCSCDWWHNLGEFAWNS